MKPCPSCEDPEKKFELDDGRGGEGGEALLYFEPSDAPPGYRVVDNRYGADDARIEMPVAESLWDFAKTIRCVECLEEVRAGKVLEPTPASLMEFVRTIGDAREAMNLGEHYEDERLEHLEEAIVHLIHAKNLAARGIKKEEQP
jgi:hypothetical protein